MEASWDRVLWDSVDAGAHDRIMAPDGCGSYVDTGAPIMLLNHAGLIEDEWVTPLLIVLEPSSTFPVACGSLG